VTDLILEEAAQWFDEVEGEVLGESTDVVVALDVAAWPEPDSMTSG